MRVATLRETRGATTAKAAAAPSTSSRSRSFRHGGARRLRAGAFRAGPVQGPCLGPVWASRHLRRSEGDLVHCRSASEVSVESPVAVEGIDLAGNEKEDRRTSTADILRFALPALGVFLSSPLMSLIDTVVQTHLCPARRLRGHVHGAEFEKSVHGQPGGARRR